MFLINFLIAFTLWNYDISLFILFDGNMTIEQKVLLLQNIKFDFMNFLFIPFLVTIFYVYFLPIINLIFNVVYYKYIDIYLKEFQNQQQSSYYKNKKTVEEIRLINTVFLEKELENKFNKESLDLQTKINIEKEKEKKIEEEKVSLKNKALANFEKRN